MATLLALPAAAEAGNAEPRILWTAPPDCPTEADVVHEVEQLLRQPLSQSRGPAMIIEGRISRVANHVWKVELELISS